jgi:hypothetical protein
MAERSKALDWNSSNILTGVPGFESLSLRQNNSLRSVRRAQHLALPGTCFHFVSTLCALTHECGHLIARSTPDFRDGVGINLERDVYIRVPQVPGHVGDVGARLKEIARPRVPQMPHAAFSPERRARENAERLRLNPIFGPFADRLLGII